MPRHALGHAVACPYDSAAIAASSHASTARNPHRFRAGQRSSSWRSSAALFGEMTYCGRGFEAYNGRHLASSARPVATVSDFLTVVLSHGAGPVRKGRVRRPEEKTTVRKSLTVATDHCGKGTRSVPPVSIEV